MDVDMELRWRKVISRLEDQFGEGLDLEAILFLIGIREFGAGPNKFKKDEKLNLMHIAICTVLEPLGYYRYSHRDEEGWLHFDVIKKLPFLQADEQKALMRRAVVEYFERETLIQPE